MYLPTQDQEQRNQITSAFKAFEGMCRKELWPKYGAAQHWAKIELVPDRDEDEEEGEETPSDWKAASARPPTTTRTDRREALETVRRRFGETLSRFEELRMKRDP